MNTGKVAIRFSMRGLVERLPVIEQQTETGTMRVATPETCAFDLVRYPEAAGHRVRPAVAGHAERRAGGGRLIPRANITA